MNERLRGIDGPMPRKQKPGEYIRRTSRDPQVLPSLQERTETMRRERHIREETEKIIAFAIETGKVSEGFPFPGIDPDVYQKIKTADEEHPGLTTPIDIIVERFKTEGMKVSLGKHPESGSVYILPLHSNDIYNDSVMPRQLQINESMDPKLRELIQRSRDIRRLYK